MSQLCRRDHRATRKHLQLVSAPAAEPVTATSHGMARAYPQALQRLLRAAGGGATLERAGEGSFRTRGRHGFELSTAAYPSLQPLARAGVCIHVVPALPGVTRSLSTQCPRLIVGLPDTVDAALCDALATLLRRALPGERQVTAVEHLAAYRGLRDQIADQELRLLDGAEAMTELMHDTPAGAALLLPTGLAEVFAAAAHSFNGTAALAVKVEAGPERLFFVHEASGATPVEPGVLVQALGWLMLALGKSGAAARLHNALLKTLEDGIHTDAMALLNPYARIVADTAMLDAIGERLDQKPSRLNAVDYGDRDSHNRGRVALTCIS